LPAKIRQLLIVIIPGTFEGFLDGKIVLAANHHCNGNFQRIFRLQIIFAANHQYYCFNKWIFRRQNYAIRKSSLSLKNSKTFSTAKRSSCKSSLSQNFSKTFLPVINVPLVFKDFLACKIVLAANRHNPGNSQRLLRLQKHSHPQIINIPELFSGFFD